jgi:hypothetical protein
LDSFGQVGRVEGDSCLAATDVDDEKVVRSLAECDPDEVRI